MSTITTSQTRRPNRRSSIRRRLRTDVHIECRKGIMGLGPNLTHYFLDISQTGVRLALKAPLQKGEEAEVLITGAGPQAIKRMTDVVWSLPMANGCHGTGLHFRQEMSFAELQQITRPA